MLNVQVLNNALDSKGLNKIEDIKSIGLENLYSNNGNIVANQFNIVIDTEKALFQVFQSYNTIIAVRSKGVTVLDINALEYSNTTLKYLKSFLGTSATKKDLYKKIEDGVFLSVDLNAK